MELHPIGPARDNEIEKNKKLVERSAGMLAPVTGSERVASVGNSHCAAFCKAAIARCFTNITCIADAAGRIDLNLLASSNSNFATMLGVGWQWFVVPYWIGDEVPGFPHLAQQALNASHAMTNQATEIEVAASIAEVVDSQGPAIDWKAAIAMAASTQPPCVDYIATVGLYVKQYGGGPKAQLIHFLAGFAKEYTESLKLGQEFMKAITEMIMVSNKSTFIHLRTAILATQLSASKKADGIAKLLTKADLNTLRAKPMQAKVEQVENMLDAAWHELQGLAGTHSEGETFKLYGMLCIRLVLKMTKKEKLGCDTTEYDSFDDILAVFHHEKTNNGSSGPVSSSSSSTGDAPATIGDASNPLWIAMQKMLKPMVAGNMYHNNKDHPNMVFKLTKLDITGASFLEHNVLKPDAQPVHCKLEELNKWIDHKGKLHKLVDNSLFSTCKSDLIQLELDKCLVFTELCKLAADNEVGSCDLMYTLNPSELLAGRAFKKGELKLVPMTDGINRLLSKTNTSKAHQISVGANKLWLTPPGLPKLEELTTPTTTAIVAPYWWVKPTLEPEAVNMIDLKLKTGEISFVGLTNNKAIKKYDKLLKADAAMQPLKKLKST
jgi:hypothetical protein